jgi:hypothetical protein
VALGPDISGESIVSELKVEMFSTLKMAAAGIAEMTFLEKVLSQS